MRNTAGGIAQRERLEETAREFERNFDALRRLCRSDPPGTLARARQAAGVARRAGLTGIQAKALYLCAEAGYYLGDGHITERAATELGGIVERIGDPLDKAMALYTLGVIRCYRRDFITAYTLLNRALQLQQSLGESRHAANTIAALGTMAMDLGDYEQALRRYFEVLPLWEHLDVHPGISHTLNSIGTVYGHIGDYGRAIEHYQRALAFTEADTIDRVVLLGNIGRSYMVIGQLEQAMEILHQALATMQTIGSGYELARVLDALGNVHRLRGDNDQALCYADQAIAALSGDDPPPFILTTFCEIHQRRGDMESALRYGNEALKYYQRLGVVHERLDLCRILSEIHRSLGNIEQAFDYHREWATLQEQLLGTERQRAVAALELRHAIEVQEKEHELLRLKTEQAEREAEFKTRELNAVALRLTQREEMLKMLHRLLKSMTESSDENVRQAAVQLLETIGSAVDPHTEWKRFEEQFERVHRRFIDKLQVRNAQLTPTELRICVLIRLNMSSKEIAGALFSSVDTVQTHRKNIRRKLALGSGTNLTSFLVSL